MDWMEQIGITSPQDESINVLNVEDSESEWMQQRTGKFTSSRIGDLMTKGRGKDKFWGDTAMNYIYEKVAELMTGLPTYVRETAAMAWGSDHEEEAINYYNSIAHNSIEHMGTTFVKFNDSCGGSPDGFIKDNWVAEIKCPYNSGKHIKTVLTREIDKNYMYQCQANMLFSGRDYCMFISYDPRMKHDNMKMAIIPIKRNEEICNAILERIEKATEEILKIQEKTGVEIKIKL